MPVEVHSEPLKRRFIAPWASLACLLNLLVLVGAFVLPVYICWATGTPSWGGLWQYEVVKYEQLALTYNNTFVVEVQGLKGAATGYRAPFVALYTSSAAANDLLGAEALRGMVVRSSFVDANYDGVGDGRLKRRLLLTQVVQVDMPTLEPCRALLYTLDVTRCRGSPTASTSERVVSARAGVCIIVMWSAWIVS